ncbi:MAG: histidinol dehydrogenase [Bacteroidota bacterium]
MQLAIHPSPNEWDALLQRPAKDFKALESSVRAVMQDVKNRGDAALREYTHRFDGVELSDFKVASEEIAAALKAVPAELLAAIEVAITNVKRFHRAQIQEPVAIETMPGVVCWRKSVAIDKVGLYIPGGTAPLFSTVVMLATPAQLAGCREIILCTPPRKDGSVHPAILAAAHLCGVTQIFKIGGAQAIAAMTFGTATVPAVYKLFGPGNPYVTVAKQLALNEGLAIDMPAGPSEVLVCADEGAKPVFVAADLLSQAEHGSDSQVVLVTFSEAQAQAIMNEVNRLLATLPRKEMAADSIKNSVAIVVEDEATAAAVINTYAPEHLILSMSNAKAFSHHITNAGSIFLGYLTPESVGDYASGTNHTLPTYGYAKQYSGVSLDSFVKKITFQELSAEGLRNLGPSVMTMAAAEELEAHRLAVELRLNKMPDYA